VKLSYSYKLIFIIFFIFSISIDQSLLPDYAAYERIFYTSDNSGDWEILFTSIMYITRIVNIDYPTFRILLLFVCLSSTYKFIKTQNIIHQHFKFSLFSFIIIFFTLNLFMIEFFLIRIRAGLCISFIFLSITYLYNRKFFFSIFLFILTFFIHKTTFFILLLILIPSIYFDKYFTNYKNFYFILNIIITILILFYTNSTYEERGIGLNSPLNIVRFYALCIPPLLIYFLYKKENLSSFNLNFNSFYIIFIIGLIIFYFLGYTENTGEAIVRVYTLASVPSFFSIFKHNSLFNNKLNTYIILSNCLFFLYTIGFFILFKTT
jgi:hypothetical protein